MCAMTSILPALRGEAARDEQLIAALRGCATRDVDALRELYELAAPRLLGQLVHMLGDPAEADAALQDSFVQIWHRASHFSAARSRPDAWLLAVARHQALDRLRARPQSAPADAAAVLTDEDFTTPTAPHRCLQALAPEQQRCLRLAYITGQTSDEIARQIQLPPATVKIAIRRALQELGRCMQADKAMRAETSRSEPSQSRPKRADAALDYIAGAYVAGTLALRVRRRFESLLRHDVRARRALQQWDQMLSGLAADVPPARPADSTLPAILARIQSRSTRGPIGPRRWALITALVLAAAVVVLMLALVKRRG